jgi:hypothetical protein
MSSLYGHVNYTDYEKYLFLSSFPKIVEATTFYTSGSEYPAEIVTVNNYMLGGDYVEYFSTAEGKLTTNTGNCLANSLYFMKYLTDMGGVYRPEYRYRISSLLIAEYYFMVTEMVFGRPYSLLERLTFK